MNGATDQHTARSKRLGAALGAQDSIAPVRARGVDLQAVGAAAGGAFWCFIHTVELVLHSSIATSNLAGGGGGSGGAAEAAGGREAAAVSGGASDMHSRPLAIVPSCG